MTTEIYGEAIERRAGVHRALGDEGRLRLVDCLAVSDRTPGELARLTALSSNLLAFHLGTLEEAGLVERRRSEGDARRRYVRLRWDTLAQAGVVVGALAVGRVVFVCTHNSARSQFAEALWRHRGLGEAWSAGNEPAARVHPLAVEAADHYGVDLRPMRPKGYDAVPAGADVVISVCDRAFEAGNPLAATTIHWSVPDPARGERAAFAGAFAEIAARISRLSSSVQEPAA